MRSYVAWTLNFRDEMVDRIDLDTEDYGEAEEKAQEIANDRDVALVIMQDGEPVANIYPEEGY